MLTPGVVFLIVEIDDEADLIAHKIVVAGVAALEHALDAPTEIVCHIEKGLLHMVLHVEHHVTAEIIDVPFFEGSSFGFLQRELEVRVAG